MHNPESVVEKHKILWDFEIQTVHLISARRPDLVIVNKKREPANCVMPGGPQGRTETKQKREISS